MVKTKNQVPNISVLFYMFLLVFLQFDVVKPKFSCRPFLLSNLQRCEGWILVFQVSISLPWMATPMSKRPEWTCFTIIHLDDNDTHICYFYHHPFPREDSSVHFHGDQMVKGMVSVKQSTWAYRTNPKDPWAKNKKPPHSVEIQVFWLT